MHHHNSDSLAERIAARTGQHPALCYQCGKCSAGCPVRAFAHDPPNRVVRFAQLGFEDHVLHSETPWLCAGCLTCSARCPQRFDLAAFMDAVRELARAESTSLPAPAIRKFHSAFLNQIRRHGRAYELGLVAEYKLATGRLLQDVTVAPGMFLRRKLGLTPHRISGRVALRRLFHRSEGGKS